MQMRKGFEIFNFVRAVFIFLSVSIIFSQSLYAQDDVIRVDTNLVTVPVIVLDREGRYVTNLRKENFQIFEDGVEQEVALFEPVEQQITVLLLLDVSSSMFNDLEGLTKSASAFLGQLRPNDQVMIATFNDSVDVLFDFKSVNDVRNMKKLRVKLNGLPPVTMVYDAVEFGLKKMKKINGRKAIVLFSDGVGSGLSASARSNLRDAEENEALIYTVQFNTLVLPPGYKLTERDSKRIKQNNETATQYMSELAAKTGGQHFQMDNIADLEKTFAQIAAELGQQYSLSYYSTQSGKKGERRQIKVKVNIPNTAVRARDSYIVGASKKTSKKIITERLTNHWT
jgi:VWFA-related protein